MARGQDRLKRAFVDLFCFGDSGGLAAAKENTSRNRLPDEVNGPADQMYKVLKRVLDVVVAGFLIAILSPLLGVLWLGIVLSLGRPGVLVQWRPGFRGIPFGLYKFRTMTGERDSTGHLLPDECRLTRLGGFLRRTSLDELPELFNVLKGDMSLVGPRPLLVEYLPLYDQRQSRRHEVRPGVTGLAQVSGRNAITWERKFDLDVYYVDHISFWVDMRILFLTVWKVLKSEGIRAEGHATMPPFRGSHNANVSS